MKFEFAVGIGLCVGLESKRLAIAAIHLFEQRGLGFGLFLG